MESTTQLKNDLGASFWGPLLGEVGDLESLERRLSAALRSASLAFQAVVCTGSERIFGHEALLRAEEGWFDGPEEIVRAAAQVGLRHEVGRLVRRRLVHFMDTGVADDQAVFFVNVTGSDLLDPHLYAGSAALSSYASRVVLELTDGPELRRVAGLSKRVAALRQVGYRFALEEASQGPDTLSSLDLVDPELVRVGRGGVRGLEHSPEIRRRVTQVVSRASARGCLVVAGRVETASERNALRDLGVDLLQGYFVQHPGARPIHSVRRASLAPPASPCPSPGVRS